MSESSTTYSRAVFEHIFKCLRADRRPGSARGPSPSDLIGDLVDIRDDGVWFTEAGLALDWSPACDMDWLGSSDPLTTPALPFPFTARELAAWMLDGPGFFVAEEAGPFARGPTKRALGSLGARGVKTGQGARAREALTAAYAAIRGALAVVGDIDRTVIESGLTARWRDEQWLADRAAKKANNWTEPGIDCKESKARRKRYLNAVKPGRAAQRDARRAADEYFAAWRRKMVRALVGPPSTEATSATGTEHEGPVSGKVRSLRQPARDVLAPLIDRVRAGVKDPNDSALIWGELERLARLPPKERPAPLCGVNSGGIQWMNGGVKKTLTRKAFGGRLKRAKDREASPSLAEPRK